MLLKTPNIDCFYSVVFSYSCPGLAAIGLTPFWRWPYCIIEGNVELFYIINIGERNVETTK